MCVGGEREGGRGGGKGGVLFMDEWQFVWISRVVWGGRGGRGGEGGRG